MCLVRGCSVAPGSWIGVPLYGNESSVIVDSGRKEKGERAYVGFAILYERYTGSRTHS